MLLKRPAQCLVMERAIIQADVRVLSSQACGLQAAPARAHVHGSRQTVPTTFIIRRDQQASSRKGQIVNISGFAGQTVSVATPQLCRRW